MTFRQKLSEKINLVGIIFLIASVSFCFLKFYNVQWPFGEIVKILYPNLASEFLSIAITILLINFLYEKKEKNLNKRRLIRELGSEDKGFTSRALKEIIELGYHNDGTLAGINLAKANLEGLDLSGLNLKNVDFSFANLNTAILKGCNLDGAILNDAQLREVNLEDCSLNQTQMARCNFYSARMNRSILTNCELLKANLAQCELIDATINSCKLEEAVLKLGNFNRSSFELCTFSRADVTSANLRNTKFTRCNFSMIIGWESVIDIETAEISAPENLPTN